VRSGDIATCLKNREWKCGVDVRGSGWTSFLRTRKVLMVMVMFRGTGFPPECAALR